MEAPKTLRVPLLPDEPAEKDAFGGHARIAGALEALIRYERGGNAVALIGGWGSGKSTVIRFLGDRLRQGPKGAAIGLFVFDAWSHEGDPLRRVFLEQLIALLSEKKWIKQAKWEERLEELSGRRSTATTTSVPRLTLLGRFVALPVAAALTLVPLGAALIAAFPQEKLWFGVGLALSVLPIVLAVLLGIPVRVIEWWRGTQGTAFLGLFTNQAVEVQESETLATPEPTSVEFQRWFCELADEALSQDRRLVIVMDNLDRVDSGTALQLWSVMRAFLDFPARSRPAWVDSLWVVVPFDETGVAGLWRDTEPKAFIEKTFQVQFSMPPIVLSDWRSFLLDQLRSSFPGATQSTAYSVASVFSALRSQEAPPTPRSIKLFVNRLAASSASQPEEIGLPEHAVFVILLGRGWTPMEEVPNEHRLAAYLAPSFRDDLTALFFNMPKEKALQVFYGEEIERAISDCSSERLAEIRERPGLEAVVGDILDERLPLWLENEPMQILRASKVFASAGLFDAGQFQQIRARLMREVSEVQEWPVLDADGGDGLAVLIAAAPSTELPARILRALQKTTPKPESEEAEQKTFEVFMRGVRNVVEAIESRVDTAELLAQFSMGTSADSYVELMAAIPEVEGRAGPLARLVRPAVETTEVTAELQKRIQSGTFGSRGLSAVKAIVTTDLEFDWSTLVNAATSRLQGEPNMEPPEVAALTGLGIALAPQVAQVTDRLRAVVDSGWVFHHLYASHSASSSTSLASCALLALMFEPEAGGGKNPGNAAEGRNQYRSILGTPAKSGEVVEEIARLAVEAEWVDELLESYEQGTATSSVISEVVRKWSARRDAERILTPTTFRDEFDALKEILEEQEFRSLLEREVEAGGLVSELIAGAFDAEASELYQDVLSVEGTDAFISWVCEGLMAISKERWLESLSGDDQLAGLLLDLKDLRSAELGHALGDALRTQSDQMVAGKASAVRGELLGAAVFALAADQVEVFKRHLRGLIVRSDRPVEPLLEGFPVETRDRAILLEEADRLLSDGFRRIIERGRPAEVKWAADIVEDNHGLAHDRPDYIREDLRRRLEEALQSDLDEDVRVEVSRLADACGLSLNDPAEGTDGA